VTAVTLEDRGGWVRASRPPHPALRPFLASYEGYLETGVVPSRMRTLPTRHTVVIISFGPPLRLQVPDPGVRTTEYDSFIAGMHDGHGMYSHPGGQRGIQLDVTPLGSYTLFGVPMGGLANQAVELGAILGPRADAFVARLAETPDWAVRFDLLDDLLLHRLEVGPEPAPEVTRAWQLLYRSGGRMNVADLAGDVGWSRKHLGNRFRDQAGLSPKVMARVLRFHRAVDLMTRDLPSWVDIALACGYYDQAHLNREFKAMSGCTPTELHAERVADLTVIPAPAS